MSNRIARVSEIIKREVSMLIERDLGFRNALTTIHAVDMTPDLRQCHVFVSILGTPAERRSVMERLEKERVSMQAAIAKRVTLRNTPVLNFRFDTSIERGDRVIQLLNELDIPEDADEAGDQPE